MLLKRVFDKDKLTHVQVLHAGPRQKFSPDLIDKAIREGWLERRQGRFVLKSEPVVVYRIVREPGYYCCHCGQELPDAGQMVEGGRTVGLAHVATHGARSSPDRNNPSGYARLNAYDCEKEA